MRTRRGEKIEETKGVTEGCRKRLSGGKDLFEIISIKNYAIRSSWRGR